MLALWQALCDYATKSHSGFLELYDCYFYDIVIIFYKLQTKMEEKIWKSMSFPPCLSVSIKLKSFLSLLSLGL